MKVTVLIDNIKANSCLNEWGLSFFIEYKDKKILLDTGSSDKFVSNAKTLGIDLKEVDYGVLSHAHYDHSDGLDAFFNENDKALFYVQKASRENCYVKVLFYTRYIGIKQGILNSHKDRIVYVDKKTKLFDGVHLLGHSSENLERIGRKEHMYLKENHGWRPDDFAHEQTLVIELNDGLVVFNSCSHGGFLNIIQEINKEYPNKKVLAYFGGLHLFNKNKKEVSNISEEILGSNIDKIYTGHCTGDESFRVMKDILVDKIEQFKCGAVYEFND